MSKFTPGPWVLSFAENGTGNNRVDVRSELGLQFIADCRIGGDSKEYADAWRDESEANARLIAAAPELLEALKNIENDDGSIPPAIWGLRNYAIAKAEGRDK